MKKIISLLLAAVVTISVMTVGLINASAHTAENSSTGADNVFYFDADTTDWTNCQYISCWIFDHTDGDEVIYWGSKKGRMENTGNGIWCFDFDAKGLSFDSSHAYNVIITADWENNRQTCDLIFTAANIGDTVYCTGEMVEHSADSNQKSYESKWRSGINGNPVCISSIGNVLGDCYWPDESAYSVFVRFLSSDGPDGIRNAMNYNGKSEQQTIDDTAAALGLGTQDIKYAIAESGRSFNWSEGGSTSGGESSSGSSSSSSSGTWSNLFSFKMQEDGTLMLTRCTGKIDEIPQSYPENINFFVENPYLAEGETPDYKNVPVTAIGDWAFANNIYIESLTIPDTVKTVGTGAFYNCVCLKSIDIPDGVTSIGANAFEKCLYLESIDLGSSLTSIGDEAFYDCRRLKALDIPGTVTSIGEEAFTNCRSLTKLEIPNGVQKLGDSNSVGFGMFENCKSLKEITIPATVSSIQENAFDGCNGVTLLAARRSYAAGFAAEQKLMHTVVDSKLTGDSDQDGVIDISDATAIQIHLSEGTQIDEQKLVYSDANGDGRVSVDDVTVIQRYLAKFLNTIG